MIYCINPNCKDRVNPDGLDNCSSCGTSLNVKNRLTLTKRITYDDEVETYEVLDFQAGYSGAAGSYKILKVLKSLDFARLTEFQNEADILMSLKHESIPKVDALHDFFELNLDENNKIYCLIMSKFDGIRLDKYIEEQGAISQVKALEFLGQLIEIINYIHTKQFENFTGIIHRDIKPSNIIVQPSGQLALIDFGFALKMTESYRELLRTGELSRVISMFYTAPEQISQKPVIQSDYYALGMTMIFAVTGKQLYEIEINQQSWKLLWQKYAKIDKPFVQFLENLTDTNPDKRPQNSETLEYQLNQNLIRKLYFYKTLKSKYLRFSISVLTIIIVVILINFVRFELYKYFYDAGNESLDKNLFHVARNNFETAIKIYPKADAYYGLGIACKQTGDINCAEQSYKSAIKMSPNDWTGYYQLGTFYEDKVDPEYQKAEQSYKKAIELSHSNAFLAQNNLARILIIQGHYNEAETYIINALALEKDNKLKAVLRKNLGWLYVQTHKYKEAEEELKESSKLDPSLTGPYCLLSQVYGLKSPLAEYNIKLCLGTNGEDLMYSEVSRWRNEVIDELVKQRHPISSP